MKKLFFGILPFVILLASCSKDGKGIGDGGKEPGKGEAKELNLSFDVVMPNQAQPNPNQKSSSTYALSEVNENTVAVIDVLAFWKTERIWSLQSGQKLQEHPSATTAA